MATLIHDVTELQAIESDLDGDYELANDIDASATSSWNGGEGFIPIGGDSPHFTGSLDGKGYSITNLTINRSITSGQALFGYISTGAVITNIRLVTPSITGHDNVAGFIADCYSGESFSSLYVAGGTIIGAGYRVGGVVAAIMGVAPTFSSCWSTSAVQSGGGDSIGGFIGLDNGSGATFINCYATGIVTGSSAGHYVGGFVGYVQTGTLPSTYTSCYATGNVSGDSGVGGFVGYDSHSHTTFSECYATGNVSCSETGDSWGFGGFAGEVDGTPTNCYAKGNVTGPLLLADGYTGGFAGVSSTIVNCYSTGLITGNGTYVGGLIGSSSGITTSSYWDTQTSGTAISDGGTGKTTAEMKDISTFSAWEIQRTETDLNDGYPFLGWQDDNGITWLITGALASRETVDVEDKITLEAIRNIEMSSGGKFYIDEEGNAVYNSRFTR